MIFGRGEPALGEDRGRLDRPPTGFGRPEAAQISPKEPQLSPPAIEDREHDETAASYIGTLAAMGRARLTLLAAGLILVLMTIEAIAADSALITPLPDGVAFYATAIGAVLGLFLSIYFWVFHPQDWKGIRKTLALLFGMPLLVGGWANMMVWRVAEHAQFGLSDAAWERAAYPVTGVGVPSSRGLGFSRYTIDIDPFDVGGDIEIPMPEEQFDIYARSRGDVCVVVEQRRSASGAIQVRTDGSLNLFAPEPVEFVQCPA